MFNISSLPLQYEDVRKQAERRQGNEEEHVAEGHEAADHGFKVGDETEIGQPVDEPYGKRGSQQEIVKNTPSEKDENEAEAHAEDEADDLVLGH